VAHLPPVEQKLVIKADFEAVYTLAGIVERHMAALRADLGQYLIAPAPEPS
jgi:hypothetical protein